MELLERSIVLYKSPSGKVPFREWFERLGRREQLVVDARLTRLRQGNLGLFRSIGKGVKELKINFGPGYRVYFGECEGLVIILLCGGDKSTQKKDIEKAWKYFNEYQKWRIDVPEND